MFVDLQRVLPQKVRRNSLVNVGDGGFHRIERLAQADDTFVGVDMDPQHVRELVAQPWALLRQEENLISQVVEAELVARPIRDIAGVGRAFDPGGAGSFEYVDRTFHIGFIHL